MTMPHREERARVCDFGFSALWKVEFQKVNKEQKQKKNSLCFCWHCLYVYHHAPLPNVPIVMYDCDFQGGHCMKHNRWLISSCTRGNDSRKIISLFFLSLSLHLIQTHPKPFIIYFICCLPNLIQPMPYIYFLHRPHQSHTSSMLNILYI